MARAEHLGLKEKLDLKESCAVEGRVQRAMVKIVNKSALKCLDEL